MVANILIPALILLTSPFVRADLEGASDPEKTHPRTPPVTTPMMTPVMADDGLHRQAWFLESFLELADDLAEAQGEGKRFVILWEQKGCPYCEELHRVNLANPEIHRYMREHFTVLQLNLWGDRAVTDFDGEVLAEKVLARKWGVVFTPTLHFFVEEHELKPGESGYQPGNRQFAAVMPGYFRPFHFARMLEYVRGRHYDRLHFQKYVAEKVKALGAGAARGNVLR
uniref:Thioredoxin-related protein n=1 Tax=Candidatus Kentrum eta TaxID=2126337 RepID=A0A450UM84_9GAMM|nr:MAG: Thioredoxin-related protein [Candidatus Kentron sp. H]VFJ94422.1 MAG: Thioredoxin-related protein [Candidatus Kentron sp. H]VFK01070.1 MAG: Thioredoxin-related protein [Candidatus Kentron sp. H]